MKGKLQKVQVLKSGSMRRVFNPESINTIGISTSRFLPIKQGRGARTEMSLWGNKDRIVLVGNKDRNVLVGG